MAAAPLLEVDELTTRFSTHDGDVLAADQVSFTLERGETLGIVGESGSGKTQLFLAIMGLLARNGRVEGAVRFKGEPILGLKRSRLDTIRGVKIAMIFQDPMTSLNPYLTVGRQMSEVLIEHKGMGASRAKAAAIAMLDRVGIPAASRRFVMYPHELSGGMRQRVMIATALLCEPELLIADEPTTALDVTIQAQILELLRELKADLGMAMALVTHDLGVIAGACDRVMVMYAGRIAEMAPVQDLFTRPLHPYTAGLMTSMPRLDVGAAERLRPIAGQPPDLVTLPRTICPFAPRCPRAFERCHKERPELRQAAPDRASACHLELAA